MTSAAVGGAAPVTRKKTAARAVVILHHILRDAQANRFTNMLWWSDGVAQFKKQVANSHS